MSRKLGSRNVIARLEPVRYQTSDGHFRIRLRLVVNWQGRHRYSLKIDDSRQARRLWAVKLKEIERKVLMGTFDPGKFGFGCHETVKLDCQASSDIR